MESFSSPILTEGRTVACPDDAVSTTDSLLWEARFMEAYPDIYPAVRVVAKPFVGKDALVILPSSYRSPNFWKDLYSDMHNVRSLPDGGALLRTVEKLMNGEKPDRGESVKELVNSFWTLLVALLNLNSTCELLLPLVLKYDSSLLDYASAEVIERLNIVLGSGGTSLDCLVEDSYLYLLKDSRVVLSDRCKTEVLSVSCFRGYLEVVRLFLGEPDRFSTVDLASSHYLSLGLVRGNTELVRLLLVDGRVDPAAEESDALFIACEGGHTGIVALLLADGRAEPANIVCCWWGWKLEVVHLLLQDRRADPSQNGNMGLQLAAKCGNVWAIKLLLEDRRASPSAHGNTALLMASWGGHLEIVQLLLKDGRADPTVNGNNLIIGASEKGDLDLVRLLLEDGRADPTENNNQAITRAVEKGNLLLFELLLTDERVRDSSIESLLLLLASSNQRTGVVKFLLEDGRADPTVNNNQAITHASKDGNLDLVVLLLADERVREVTDETQLLLFASMSGSAGLVKFLVQDGKAGSAVGRAILLASGNGHLKAVRILLEDPRAASETVDEAIKVALAAGPRSLVQSPLEDPPNSRTINSYPVR